MEAFTLLKYWRGGGGGVAVDHYPRLVSASQTTLDASAGAEPSDDDDDSAGDDDGPFFDLEFAPVPDDEQEEAKLVDGCEDNAGHEGGDENGDIEGSDVDDDDDDRELNFTLSSASSGSSNDDDDCMDASNVDGSVSDSPSDDLFFKGKLVPIEPPDSNHSDKPQAQQQLIHASFLKSATRLRVFMLGLKKSKPCNVNVPDGSVGEKPDTAFAVTSKQQRREERRGDEGTSGKLFTVKLLKVEEVPIVSLFTRDNSSRGTSGGKPRKKKPQGSVASSDEKRFTREVMQRYLNKVKPLYVRVSKRYGEKLWKVAQDSAERSRTKGVRQSQVQTQSEVAAGDSSGSSNGRNIPAGLRVVCKHLGKSRSASSAVAAAPPPSGQAAVTPPASSRRDDSLLQQQDGIQSAILHCKRSFNASRDLETVVLARCVSDSSSHKKTAADSSRDSPSSEAGN